MRNFAFAKFAGIGVAGWISGILYERYYKADITANEHKRFPNFRQYLTTPKVWAATAFPPKKGGGVVPITPTPGEDQVDANYWNVPTDFDVEKQNRLHQIMRFGFPGHTNVRSFDDYVVSYDNRNRVAHWVFEHLNRTNTKWNPEVDRSRCEFFEDHSIHPYFRSTNLDYKGSGYDRGHLAAAGNHRSAQSHCEQTFSLANIAPQVGKGFNRDAWNRLEKHVRSLTKTYPNVYVCTGPLYLPKKEPNGRSYVRYEVIGNNHVAVPTHFFKVLVAENSNGELDMESYIMPNQVVNDNVPVEAFMVPIDAIERASGLIFFDKVNRSFFRHINGRKSKSF